MLIRLTQEISSCIHSERELNVTVSWGLTPLSPVFQLSHGLRYYGRRKTCNTTLVKHRSEFCGNSYILVTPGNMSQSDPMVRFYSSGCFIKSRAMGTSHCAGWSQVLDDGSCGSRRLPSVPYYYLIIRCHYWELRTNPL